MCLGLLLAVMVSQTFLGCYHLDSFKEDWSGKFQSGAPLWEFVLCPSHAQTGIVGLKEDNHRDKVSF